MSEAFELALSGDDVSDLVRVYREHRPTLSLRPGAAAVLEAVD